MALRRPRSALSKEGLRLLTLDMLDALHSAIESESPVLFLGDEVQVLGLSYRARPDLGFIVDVTFRALPSRLQYVESFRFV